MSEENLEEEVSQEEMDNLSEEMDVNQKPLLDKNGKLITGVLVAVILLIGGWYSYQKFYAEPLELAAHDKTWWAENMLHFNEDNTAAIDGDSAGFYDGFSTVVEDIAGTQAGLIAQFDLGIAYLNDGQYELARTTLNGVDFGDVMVTSVAKGAIGDSYMQENDANNAVKFYTEAVDYSANTFTCPIYLKKCAFAYEILKDWNSAIANYERIKKDFPESEEALTIDKYLIKAKSNV